jgi:hypothetical protein
LFFAQIEQPGIKVIMKVIMGHPLFITTNEVGVPYTSMFDEPVSVMAPRLTDAD